MKFFKPKNIFETLPAWGVFLLSLIIYLITLEPTVSFWDCGEFIASAYKLEVGHPPGAPIFMLLGRFFSLFAPDTQSVAMMVNSLSAFASAFTVFFLYQIIFYYTQKLLSKEANEKQKKQLSMFAGLTGSLIFAFSDTFWFSAVEAEVYALSVFFTALVVWLAVKWDINSEKKSSEKYLILIAYFIGLSTGVHLLNILAVPAIVFIVYFKKYKTSIRGMSAAFGISVLIIAFLMYGVIQGFFVMSAEFELFMVNKLNLPYQSGVIFTFVLIISLLIIGIVISHKKNKALLNTVFNSILVIFIGYSSYAVILIRSNADTPMNENDPNNAFSMISYLNREQYASSPLIFGQTYTSELKKDENGRYVKTFEYTYEPINGKYEKIKKQGFDYEYTSDSKMFFPRMHSSSASHIRSYKSWGNIPDDVETPSFLHNFRFFVKYQLGHMYFRYLMWNFAGRQNNIEGNGYFMNGNWISGVPPIDKALVGSQENLPPQYKNNEGRNVYYFLPFLLAFLGLVYTYWYAKREFSVIMLLFFFTGIAIVIYLNQTPGQPRERDYSYVGSFFAFAIWSGLGIVPIYNLLKRISKQYISVIVGVLSLFIPALMLIQNFDDHNRSGRYTALETAKNYLAACDRNAILFTFGDNDTFPLWYVQEVEGYRTDVKVINTSLLYSDWYIRQACKKSNEAPPIPFSMKYSDYMKHKRGLIYLKHEPEIFINELLKVSPDTVKNKYKMLTGQTFDIIFRSKIKNDTTLSKQLDELYKRKNSISPTELNNLINNISEEKSLERYAISKKNTDELRTYQKEVYDEILQQYLPVELAADFIKSDADYTKVQTFEGDYHYLPSKYLSLKTDTTLSMMRTDFSEKERKLFEPYIKWKINSNYQIKSDVAFLEILARNKWERPIFFAATNNSAEFKGLKDYVRFEGYVYRLVPYNTNNRKIMNSRVLYKNIKENYSHKALRDKDILIDNNVLRVLYFADHIKVYSETAKALLEDGEIEKAVEIADEAIRTVPIYMDEYSFFMIDMLEIYAKAGEKEKLETLKNSFAKSLKSELNYYNGLSENFARYTISRQDEINILLQRLESIKM